MNITIELDWNHYDFIKIMNEITECLEYSLYDYYFKPIRLKSIIIYNKESNDEKDETIIFSRGKEDSLDHFYKTIKDALCYKNIKITLSDNNNI